MGSCDSIKSRCHFHFFDLILNKAIRCTPANGYFIRSQTGWDNFDEPKHRFRVSVILNTPECTAQD